MNPEDPDAKPPVVKEVVTILPKGSRYDPSVPGSCTASDEELMLQGAAACPEDSRVGGGVITVDSGMPGPARIVTADTEFFNNAEDPEGEFIYLNTVRDTGARTVVRADVTTRRTITTAPMLPGTPPDGGAIDTVDVEVLKIARTIDGERRAYITTPPRCPRNRTWFARVQFSYDDDYSQTVATPNSCKPQERLMRSSWLSVPRDWIASFGDIAKFCARVVSEVYGGRVFRFFGEALRQAGILIVGSTLVIWGLCFILGLQCGIEGAYFSRSVGAPAQAGVFSAWCDLREIMPYAFGYMMAAKVGTGLVAEIGAMRISDEIDALEVMGISSMTFLCATRLLAAWMVLPFVYVAGIGAGFFASYLAVVQQIGEVSSGGFFLIFWMFQNPPDLFYSAVKGMAMATVVVLVGCYYGYTASGGPVGVGTATAKSMVLNTVMVHIVGMIGTQIFWGTNPRAPIGG